MTVGSRVSAADKEEKKRIRLSRIKFEEARSGQACTPMAGPF